MAKEDLQRRTDQQQAIVIPTVGPPGTAASNPTSLLGTPALVFGTANIAGASSLGIATNATIAIFDTTLPAATTLTAVVGTALFAAHRDHVHAIDQTIAPTWSAVHTFTATPQFANNIKLKVTASVNYLTLTPSADAAVTVTVPAVTDTLVNLSSNQTLSGQKTFSNATAPIISALIGPASTQQHTIPAVASDTIALLAATQTFSNKTLNNTNTVTLKDNLFTLQANADTTKQLQFALSGITTATTRTLTVPDISDTIVTLTATQTLTNKTLSGGTITGTIAGSPTLTGTWTWGSADPKTIISPGGITLEASANADAILWKYPTNTIGQIYAITSLGASDMVVSVEGVASTDTLRSLLRIEPISGGLSFIGLEKIGTASAFAFSGVALTVGAEATPNAMLDVRGSAIATGGLNVGTATGAATGEIRASDKLRLNGETSSFLEQRAITVANNGVAQVLSTVGPDEMFWIIDDNMEAMAQFFVHAGYQVVYLISDPFGKWSTTAGTASKHNIYWSVANARYEVENKIGVSVTYHIFGFHAFN